LVTIYKEKPDKDFLQIKNSHWMQVNKELGPYALQLYLYLAKNANGYKFALSPQAAENEAGIKRTSFHKYLAILMAEGYLVHRGGNQYDFYEVPQGKQTKPQDEYEGSQNELTSPQADLNCSSPDIEIDNIEIDIINKKDIGPKYNVVAEPQAGVNPCTPEQKQEVKAPWEYDGFVF
jgi:hypothetical protein